MNIILLQELSATLNCEIIYLVHYIIQDNPSLKEQILQPSVTKMLSSIVSKKISLQIDSLNKYTMWQKFKDQKKVFKKLKLVHIQSGEKKKPKLEHQLPNDAP